MKKITDFRGDNLFVHFGICILVSSLFSLFRKKEQELDGQEKVTCRLLPIDFPAPFSGPLVSPNYSSVFRAVWAGTSATEWDCPCLTLWEVDCEGDFPTIKCLGVFVDLILVVYCFL